MKDPAYDAMPDDYEPEGFTDEDCSRDFGEELAELNLAHMVGCRCPECDPDYNEPPLSKLRDVMRTW
jgi:hypothetical protein